MALITRANKNVHVHGKGMIRGELGDYTGTVGEYSFLIWVMAGPSEWSIIGPVLTESWADGIYVGGTHGTGPVLGGLIDHVVVDNNLRQGMSVTWSESLTIDDDVQLFNTRQFTSQLDLPRQWPATGLDIEPNEWSWVTDVTIGAILTENNIGGGITVQSPHSAYKSTTAEINGSRF